MIAPETARASLRAYEGAKQRENFAGDLAAARAARNGARPRTPPWAPVDLAAVIRSGCLDEPPALLARTDGARLLYRGRVHLLMGEPESCKGWLALHAAAGCLAAGEPVLYVDFEDTAASVVARLLALGVDEAAIVGRFHYVRPDSPLDESGWAALAPALETPPALAVIDGVTEALALHGLDLIDNADVARWLARFPRPLAEAGAAVLQIDHVGRDREARGRFAIGAQHKLAGVDVAYALDVLEPFGRGRDGKVKVTVAKDRPGHVRQVAGEGAKVAEIRLASHPEGAVSIEVVPPSGETDVVAFRPTALMERVSRAIEDAPGLSKNAIRSTVAGKSDYKDLALELLVSESYAEARRDGQAHHHFSLRPFRTGDTA